MIKISVIVPVYRAEKYLKIDALIRFYRRRTRRLR